MADRPMQECKKGLHGFVPISHDGKECPCGAAIVTGIGYHADGTECEPSDLTGETA